MTTINIHEAKTHLSRLVDRAAEGETIIIARSGRPIAQLTALPSPPPAADRRLGFLPGVFRVPDDFDRMGASEIETDFEGHP